MEVVFSFILSLLSKEIRFAVNDLTNWLQRCVWGSAVSSTKQVSTERYEIIIIIVSKYINYL